MKEFTFYFLGILGSVLLYTVLHEKIFGVNGVILLLPIAFWMMWLTDKLFDK